MPDCAQGEARMWYPSMSVFSHSCCPNTEALCRTNYGLALSATKVSSHRHINEENIHSSDLYKDLFKENLLNINDVNIFSLTFFCQTDRAQRQ